VAGEENYILKVRVASPAALEDLLQEIRAAASVSTRTTIVLSTPYENRPPDVLASGGGSHTDRKRAGQGNSAGDGEDPE
jgi:Lrp/AsnC family leucine-responsive transcriptional regulator